MVLQSGVDALVLSIVPGDIGRPTKRLEKATVRDGNCRWENPGLSKASAVGE
ncbi:myosin-11-like, partial [Trifolium medium]|nr:myosin-11-like [Trifolium medium]